MNLLFVIGFFLSTAAAEPSDYQLGPGDSINVSMLGEELGTDGILVNTDGKISLPYVGLIDVSGLTEREASDRIQKAYQQGYYVDPYITVKVTAFSSKQIELFGAIGKPGLYSLKGETTLRGLIAQAGGLAAEKSAGMIDITRNGITQTFKVTDLDGEGGDFLLQAGDIVDARIGSTIFLTGQVNSPGPVTFARGLTAMQAVSTAGGHTNLAHLSRSYILRDGERIRINLRRVIRGKEADIELLPGDSLVLPYRNF